MNYYRECVVKAKIEKLRFGQEELRSKLFSKICSNTNTMKKDIGNKVKRLVVKLINFSNV